MQGAGVVVATGTPRHDALTGDRRAVDRLEQQLQDWRDQLPEDVNIDVNQ